MVKCSREFKTYESLSTLKKNDYEKCLVHPSTIKFDNISKEYLFKYNVKQLIAHKKVIKKT